MESPCRALWVGGGAPRTLCGHVLSELRHPRAPHDGSVQRQHPKETIGLQPLISFLSQMH